MEKRERYSKWMFVFFPALAMMLGWGLRGHIGGGPFGAMIPGAMIALGIGLLLKLPAAATSVLLVFAVFGVGLGGEMTYGQTLGFLKSPDTVWWGTLGTTVKGAVWGLSAGAVMAIGFVYQHISKKTILLSLVIYMIGMVLGFNLINDPMLLYFSGPENPRAESWAALLLGAVLMLVFLKWKVNQAHFKLILRFSLLGLLGGGLGFGLGGFWMVLGNHLPDVIFNNWWKAMEFTFGFLLGAFLGYAAWLSRNEPVLKEWKGNDSSVTEKYPVWKELLTVTVTGLLVFWLIPGTMELLTQTTIDNNLPGGTFRDEVARMVANYSFAGFIFVLVLMRFPQAAWQIGITLTFCFTAIDLIRDFYPDANTWSPFTMYFLYIFLMTAAVALLTAYFSRNKNGIKNLFLLLIWSCVAVSFLRLFIEPESLDMNGLSFSQLVFGKYVVDLFFVVSALFISWMINRRLQSVK